MIFLLDYTCDIDRNIFQNYTTNENLNNYGLELISDGTSSEHDLHSA